MIKLSCHAYLCREICVNVFHFTQARMAKLTVKAVAYVYEKCFIEIHSCPLLCILSIVAFMLERQNGVTVTEIIWISSLTYVLCYSF